MLETALSAILKGIIILYSGLLFPLIQKYLETQTTQYQQQKQKEKEAIEQINLKYLSPLRLYLVESYIRLDEIEQQITESKEHKALYFIETPEEISTKTPSWMIGEGCYLISSCYLIACLFFTIKQLRDAVPFLKIGKNEDTELLKLMEKINIYFGGLEGGVFYVIQFSLAHDIYLSDQKRLMTYREFCEMLQEVNQRQWWDGLIKFFIRAGKGENIKRLNLVKEAIYNLSEFLDKHIGEGNSIDSRLEAEGYRKMG